jgi:hypothetical protein
MRHPATLIVTGCGLRGVHGGDELWMASDVARTLNASEVALRRAEAVGRRHHALTMMLATGEGKVRMSLFPR